MKITIGQLKSLVSEAIQQGSGDTIDAVIADLQAHTVERMAARAELRRKDSKNGRGTSEPNGEEIFKEIDAFRDRAIKIVTDTLGAGAQAQGISKDIERAAYEAGRYYWPTCSVEHDALLRRKADRFMVVLKKAGAIVAKGGGGAGSKSKTVQLFDEARLRYFLQKTYDFAKQGPGYEGMWKKFKTKRALRDEFAKRVALWSTADKRNVYYHSAEKETGVRVAKGYYDEIVGTPEFAPVLAIVTDFVKNLERTHG